MKIPYTSVEKKSTNEGDKFIELKFFQNMPKNKWQMVGASHESIDKSFPQKEKVVMVSSNMLSESIVPFGKGSPWVSRGYKYKNVVPVSIGSTKNEEIKYDIKGFFFNNKRTLLFKVLLIPFAFTLGYLVQYIHNNAPSKAIAKRRYKRAFDMDAPMSARTDESAKYLTKLGAKHVYRTGCVTTWGMNSLNIVDLKKDNIIIAFTNETSDIRELMIELASKHYKKIVIWDQSRSNPVKISSKKVAEVIRCDWKRYSDILRTGDFDYIGSRLHAGIFAMQNKTRAFFISVDNRVVDYSRVLGIEYLPSEKWGDAFSDEQINSKWMGKWKGPRQSEINNFKEHFIKYFAE